MRGVRPYTSKHRPPKHRLIWRYQPGRRQDGALQGLTRITFKTPTRWSPALAGSALKKRLSRSVRTVYCLSFDAAKNRKLRPGNQSRYKQIPERIGEFIQCNEVKASFSRLRLPKATTSSEGRRCVSREFSFATFLLRKKKSGDKRNLEPQAIGNKTK